MAGPQRHPGCPPVGDLMFSPLPAIFLPQLAPRAAGTRVLQPEGCGLGPRRLLGTGGSAGSSAPMPRPRPQGRQRWDVASLGCTDVPLSPRGPGTPPVQGHPTTRSARGRDALGGGEGDRTLVPRRSGMGKARVRHGGCDWAVPVPRESSLDPTGQVEGEAHAQAAQGGWQQGRVIHVPPQR